MSNVKNFGLIGVGQEVQLGKGGAKIASDSEKVVAKDAEGALTNVQAADPVADQDLVTKKWAKGENITLGEAGDASLTEGGAVSLTPETSVTNAVDALNEILGKLVPSSPTNFPAGQSLSVTGASTALLADGATPDNTNGGTITATAGTSVTRVTAATVASNVIGAADNVGPGDSGTVQAVVNGAVVDSQAMSTGANNKSTGVLRISNDQAYPLATPGFWESFRTNIGAAAVTQGWNRMRINHTGAGATNEVYFVRDITTTPTVTSGAVTESVAGTYNYSSGIAHYGTGGVLSVSFTATNLALETYSSGTIMSVTGSNSIFTTQNYTAGQAGTTAPLARNMAPHAASVLINVNGSNIHNSGQITATATNPNGSGNQTFGPLILVKTGTTASRVDEMNIPVSVAVNGGPSATVATRVDMTSGDNPSDDKSALTVGDWVSSNTTDAWDAAVVAGVLKHDVVNYSTGYLPVGPNRSTYGADQYVTFLVRRTAVSKFDINVTGSYAGLWVKLVDESEQYTATANGWYTMKTLYGGAGMPGDINGANGSLGCALGAIANGSGSWTCTFGTLSSTNAANNNILVRFKLTAGQSITALSFVPATR